ncbi:MAG: oxidoreductase [Acidiferrobacterales bacterium]
MKSAAIIGATGLVGQQLLKLLLASDRYDRVHSISRRPVDLESPKLIQHITPLDNLGQVQAGGMIDDAFCTLGTTIKVAGTQENFAHVDRDYVCEFAKWARRNGARAMAVNSSLGASARSRNFYLKTKGQMEDCLRDAGFESLAIVRPSLLVPIGRTPKRFGEEVAYKLMQLFRWLLVGPARRYRAVKPIQVARALLAETANPSRGVHIIESEAIEGAGLSS